MPELRDAATVIKVDDWTGMRPCREGDVRLELEELALPPTVASGLLGGGGAAGGAGASASASASTASAGLRRVMVVHNYGHAGCGHSLHWGCAQDALHLAIQAVQRLRSTATGASSSTGRTAAGTASTSSTIPCVRFEGKEPVIVEGMMTILPRLMRQLKDATAPTGGRIIPFAKL